MGERLFDEYGINITRFYGGVNRGVMYQIDTELNVDYLQLSEKEMQILQKALNSLFPQTPK